MIEAAINNACTGCEACASSCPKSCIDMLPDKEGFRRPVVDRDKCIECKKCIKVCPVLSFESNHQKVTNSKTAYAYKSNYDAHREVCSSGGVFFALAESFVKSGGIVFGAAFDSEFRLSHTSAANCDELYPMAGSKYLQSDINDTYKSAERELKSGRKVLFFAMTCQIEGLRAYLTSDYENLYCVDLICMGIPSPMVWEKYLSAFFDKNDISRINFKDKRLGWHRFSFSVQNKDGSNISIPGKDNYYMQCMFKGYSVRKSCFDCKYKCESKISDITMADCWGCENYMTDMDDNKGLSMVISHGKKGEYLIELLKEYGTVKEFEYSNVLKYNSNYINSMSPKKGRRIFYWLLRINPRLAFVLMGANPQKTIMQKIAEKVKLLYRKAAKDE